MTTPGDDEIERLVRAEVDQLETQGQVYPFRVERRCRVCQDDTTRELVDSLLSSGWTYRSITQTVDRVFNPHRRPNNKITRDSIYNHAQRHFNINAPAQAVYRKILERRAEENGQNFVDGITHSVNYMSYLETMMLQGYQKMTSGQETASLTEGRDAAIKLHEMTRKDAGVTQVAELMSELDRIITAVHRAVPTKYHAAIDAALRGEDTDVLDVEVDDGDGEIEDFSPPTHTDEADDL